MSECFVKIKHLMKQYPCYRFDISRELLVLQANAKGSLVIKQIVEISKILDEMDIIHVVYENNDIQLYIDKD